MNNTALKHERAENHETVASSPEIFSENVVQITTRQQIIAQQAEAACNLAGNKCGPDLDFFEEKYGICGFV